METNEKALAIFKRLYLEWENNPDRNKSGYDYERTYVEMMQKVQQEILQNSVGAVSKDKNVKKKSKRAQGK